MFLHNVMNGFRALKPMVGKLVLVALIILVPVLWMTVQKVRAASAPDSIYGNWMGLVKITKLQHLPTGKTFQDDQGEAVLQVHLSQQYFSYLDRFDSEVKLIDSSGVTHNIKILDLRDDWSLPAKWKSGTLITSEASDEKLRGQWNLKFAPFILKFDSLGNNEFSDGTSYTLTGALARGDASQLRYLVDEIQKNSSKQR